MLSGTAAETPAQPVPAPAQRRGGRRVQPSTPATPSPAGGLGGIVGGIVDTIASVRPDVRFSVFFLPAPGAKLPKGERRLRIVDASGRTVLSMSTQGDSIEGTRPATDRPVEFQVEIRSENPPFSLTTQRRMVTPRGLDARDILQVRPVLVKREVLIPDGGFAELVADEARLLALPQVQQAFATELPRLASGPRAELRGDKVFVVLSVFSTGLAHRQILA